MPNVRALGRLASICLLLAALAAGCGDEGGDLSSSASSASSSTTEAPCPRVAVVVAAEDIPAGTTGADAVANGLLREDEIAAAFRPATAITSFDQVTDAVVAADISANEVVTSTHFGLPTATTLTPPASSCVSSGPTTTAGS